MLRDGSHEAHEGKIGGRTFDNHDMVSDQQYIGPGNKEQWKVNSLLSHVLFSDYEGSGQKYFDYVPLRFTSPSRETASVILSWSTLTGRYATTPMLTSSLPLYNIPHHYPEPHSAWNVGSRVIEHPFFIERTWYERVRQESQNGISVPLCLVLSLSHSHGRAAC